MVNLTSKCLSQSDPAHLTPPPLVHHHLATLVFPAFRASFAFPGFLSPAFWLLLIHSNRPAVVRLLPRLC